MHPMVSAGRRPHVGPADGLRSRPRGETGAPSSPVRGRPG